MVRYLTCCNKHGVADGTEQGCVLCQLSDKDADIEQFNRAIESYNDRWERNKAEIMRLREAFSKFINDVYENRFEADKLNIYCGNARQALKKEDVNE